MHESKERIMARKTLFTARLFSLRFALLLASLMFALGYVAGHC
jgi:hypothetical protein